MSIENELKKLIPDSDQRTNAPRVFVLSTDLKDCSSFKLVDQYAINGSNNYRLLAIVIFIESAMLPTPDHERHKKNVASGYYGDFPSIAMPTVIEKPMFLVAYTQNQVLDEMRGRVCEVEAKLCARDSECRQLESKLSKMRDEVEAMQKSEGSLRRENSSLVQYRDRAALLQADLEKLQQHYGQAAIKEVTGKK